MSRRAPLGQKMRRWYAGGPAMDGEVIARFGPAVEGAIRDELNDWAQTLEGRLALIILLDQLARNVFRDSPLMY